MDNLGGGVMRLHIVITIFFYLFMVAAQAKPAGNNAARKPSPMAFALWKSKQVNEAENRVVRLSNALLIMKSEIYSLKNTLPIVASDNQEESRTSEEVQNKQIAQTETQLRTAVEDLEMTKELGFRDYLLVYLSQYKSDTEAIVAVASSLSGDEVAEVLQILLNFKPSPNDLSLPQSVISRPIINGNKISSN